MTRRSHATYCAWFASSRAAAPMKIRRERVMVVPAVDRDSASVAISGGF
jgi:hypothetical protein